MLPIFRSLISLPAGIVKMNIALFIVLTTAGSLIWNTALISAGYLLGDNWALVENYVGLGSKIMAVIIVIALIVWAVIRIRASKSANPTVIFALTTQVARIPVSLL